MGTRSFNDVFSRRSVGEGGPVDADTLDGIDSTGFALASHNHDASYASLTHNHDTVYASLTHNHDTVYASLTHNHVEDDIADLDKYTQAQVDSLLAAKLDSASHTKAAHDALGINAATLGGVSSSGFAASSHNHDGTYEPALGNPASDGYVLSSTASGVRTWVAGGGGMVYPGSGIPVSTGSAWGTSITNNSANWNTAYSWGNHASAGYLLASSYTAADVLAKIKTVDGSGSGLDADKLDGKDASTFRSKSTEYTISSNTTAVAEGAYAVNTNSSAITVTLPASPANGDHVWICDYTGSASTHNITIARNGKLINGSSANLVLDVDHARVCLIYGGSSWFVF